MDLNKPWSCECETAAEGHTGSSQSQSRKPREELNKIIIIIIIKNIWTLNAHLRCRPVFNFGFGPA